MPVEFHARHLDGEGLAHTIPPVSLRTSRHGGVEVEEHLPGWFPAPLFEDGVREPAGHRIDGPSAGQIQTHQAGWVHVAHERSPYAGL